MRVSFAGSALLHILGASMLVPESLPGSARGEGAPLPLIVRLERSPLAARAEPAPQPEPGPGKGPASRERRSTLSGPAITPRHGNVASAPVDLTIYTAAEVDSLPVPVAPLDSSRLPGLASAESIRLELVIDEYGTVRSVSIASPYSGTGPEADLRRAIGAIAFVPARRDGRPVKSRIVLGVR
jgi:protein TonB